MRFGKLEKIDLVMAVIGNVYLFEDDWFPVTITRFLFVYILDTMYGNVCCLQSTIMGGEGGGGGDVARERWTVREEYENFHQIHITLMSVRKRGNRGSASTFSFSQEFQPAL